MQEEAYGSRDRSYSAWHRRMSIRRFVGIEAAQTLAMIDLDSALYIEYDDGTKEPIALIETAVDVGQENKPATVTTNLAKRCVPTLPAFVLLYKLSEERTNPADDGWPDIESFRAKRLWPEPERKWEVFTPQQWAERLQSMRVKSSKLVDAMLDEQVKQPTVYVPGHKRDFAPWPEPTTAAKQLDVFENPDHGLRLATD